MRPTRTFTRLAVAAALLGVLTTLPACGSDAKESPSSNPGSSSPAAEGEETDTTAGSFVDICTKVTSAEISDVLGGPVTSEAIPGGGCNFSNADDPRATSVQLTSSLVDDSTGGFDGSVAGLSGILQGANGATLEGVGDQAYVKIGTTLGSELVRGSGLVRVGSTLVQVDLSPELGTSATDVRAILVDTLNLVAPKL